MPTQTHGVGAIVATWFEWSGRSFPWRRTSDPFHIVLAEVLLRQTQATRVVEPYLELVGRYPDPRALAAADAEELRSWFKPLGLVKRADHLIATARLLIAHHGGQVPNDLRLLLGLPGLGRYSARAVLCLAFAVPVPMVDEGSGRVLGRVTGIPFRGPAYSDSRLLDIAQALLPRARSREFNLGLIDIAAAYCRVSWPSCSRCPLMSLCVYAERYLQQASKARSSEHGEP